MRLGDTIVAVAAAPGWSARTVVRISGPDARPIAQTLFGIDDWSRGGQRARLTLESGSTLPLLALCLPGPTTFTGEDSLELLLPGSPLVLDRVVPMLLRQDGARLASPGEYSARAHLNGRLTLEQAEGVAMLISARNEAERSAGARLLRGDAGDRYARLAETLADALALVEAGIDFTDQEDVVAIAPDALEERIASVLVGAGDALAGAGAARAGGAATTVVLAGAPSAGKSTLFNALLGRERAVVAAEPGTTRDALRETLVLDGESPGLEVTLVDIAGLDTAFRGGSVVDARARQAAAGAIDSADIIVYCDPTGAFAPMEGGFHGLTLRVRTKADLPIADRERGDELGVCALDGWNIGPLRRAIADAALAASRTLSGDDLTVLPRHEAALRRAVDALSQASERVKIARDLRQVDEPEVIAGLLRRALNALGEISGRIEPDDVIGRVFAHFCVGK